ncbi:hypothetical protein AAG906_020526 [Vitis piasezkii]
MYRKNKNHSDAENPTERQVLYRSTIPSYICPWLRFVKLIISKAILLVIRLRIAGSSEIRKVKEKRRCASGLVRSWTNYLNKSNKWLSQYHEDEATSNGNSSCDSEYEYFRRGHGPSTPILIAASNGIVEMVENPARSSLTIHDRDFKRKNIVLLAVENRQSHLYDFLLKNSHLRDEDLRIASSCRVKNYESWLILQHKKQRMAQQHMQFLLFHCSSNSNSQIIFRVSMIVNIFKKMMKLEKYANLYIQSLIILCGL